MQKRSFVVIFLTLLCASATFAQVSKAGKVPFDIKDFEAKLQTVQWILEYDNVAWKTSDVVMQQDEKDLKRLGREWFCFQDKNKLWHAVYGKLEGGKYEMVFHFTLDASSKIVKSDEKLDEAFLTTHAIALATAQAKLDGTIPADSPAFNQYIRLNPNKTFSVWLLPAFQRSGLAVYGGEAIYTIDATGAKIIEDNSYFQKNFRAFETDPPREIWLKFGEQEKPALSAIFFALYYKDYFTKIFIDNATTVSTIVRSNGTSLWVHTEKEKDKTVPK